ncbi:MAG TPA: hypothetical protein VK501_22495 [Baekduia sp.]|uniref:hypothetical protein n=1 Tax=Baekduia sp. TaxID=2600305 RepID=UPI002D1BCE8A|nr:hypothetical protein [Baekduia sp.]HMJ36692.1 hypothetical protein [Baekduia sp.]
MITVGALLSGTPAAGAAVYGAYGGVRALSVVAILRASRGTRGADVRDRLLSWRPRAEQLTTVWMIGAASASLAVIG